MKISVALMVLLMPTLAHAHHEQMLIEEATNAVNLGWPVIVAAVGMIMAQVKSWWR
jgi:hypothetical protein